MPVGQCRFRTATDEHRRKSAVLAVDSLAWDVTTVRPRRGKPTFVHGPFMEMREDVGSFLVTLISRQSNHRVRLSTTLRRSKVRFTRLALRSATDWTLEVRTLHNKLK